MRIRVLAALTAVATAMTLSIGVPQAGAKKAKKPKATTTTTAKSAALPGDACTLLTLDEVTPLVAGASEGKPVANGQPNEVVCRWDTEDTLQDIVLTVTKLPSSVPTAELEAALAAEAKDPEHKAVSGLGDYALVSSEIPPDAEAKVLVGHVLLDVEYSSTDPLGSTRQDDVVALAKLAFGRL